MVHLLLVPLLILNLLPRLRHQLVHLLIHQLIQLLILETGLILEQLHKHLLIQEHQHNQEQEHLLKHQLRLKQVHKHLPIRLLQVIPLLKQEHKPQLVQLPHRKHLQFLIPLPEMLLLLHPRVPVLEMPPPQLQLELLLTHIQQPQPKREHLLKLLIHVAT